MTENASPVSIRPCSGPAEYGRLVQIWRSAVDATHDFLSPADKLEIEAHLASDYFPQVKLSVAEVGGVAVGFAGTLHGSLEMLFVHDSYRGRGVGKALLKHVVSEDDVATVDVNEQNPGAAGFYQHEGFSIVGRSEVDSDGRPYPLLHLKNN
ncbi:acetyltransferase [Glutamicibacter uratoxydans]|uniref:Acetyltransferase n=1 Tax=Glutamicibacter uratoxydans TaxID=43667 RepID=A0A4Y4DRP3_GLUUR|nr:acetyltransferase [Glutamicibacter uratoxydans]GED07596.1 acetyltransferase [Glutamicibacter uratoxydans]